MGEAKKRAAKVRDEFLRQVEKWLFSPTPWEGLTVAELEAMPRVAVERATPQEIAYMRMPARYCHDNARWYERNDPTGVAKAVLGWMVDPSGNYVLHSVVGVDGGYKCLTPVDGDPRRAFDFIPDAKIEQRDDGEGHFRFFRDGEEIGPGVRSDPEQTIAECQRVKDRLLAGMHPYEAIKQ